MLAGLGAGLAYCGSLPRSPANFIVLDWRGRFGYPSSVMPIGVVMIVVAVLPASWIERAFERLVSSSTGDRRE